MKKHINFHPILLTLLALMISVTSCVKDSFLDETLKTERDYSFYDTEQGIQELAVGAYYRVFSSPFASEYQFGTTNYGTDEFHLGGDKTNDIWNNYDSRFGSIIVTTRTNAQEFWDNVYVGIGLANQLIESATNIESTNPAIKNVALGEGYFLRAFNYLKLVRQYGGVPLKLGRSRAGIAGAGGGSRAASRAAAGAGGGFFGLMSRDGAGGGVRGWTGGVGGGGISAAG